MLTNIKVYDAYEVNGKTFKGSFPIYESDAICPVDVTQVYENDLEKELQQISED